MSPDSLAIKAEQLSTEEQIELVVLILNDIDPTADNLGAFFDGLDDAVHDELINRAAERKARDQ